MDGSESFKKLAVIPAYNNTGELVKVLSKFEDKIIDEICLVLDCLTEEGMKKIKKEAKKIGTPVHIIRNTERKGVGSAIREGIKYAIGNGYDIVVVMAGNNKDDPHEISRLLVPILKEGYDYVQGSRFLPGGKHVKTPLLRIIFNRLFPLIWSLFTNFRCTEVTNGFRAYRTAIFKNENIKIWQDWLDGYALEYYIHYKVLTSGYKVKEVPVSKVYRFLHRCRYSNIIPFRDWWQIVGPLIVLKFGVKD